MLLAKDIMCAELSTLRYQCSIESIFECLLETNHNGFPVVNDKNNVIGIILRNQLIVILSKLISALQQSSNAIQYDDILANELKLEDFRNTLHSRTYDAELLDKSALDQAKSLNLSK